MTSALQIFRPCAGVLAGILIFGSATAFAEPPRVRLVYMGGDDCPPCVAWRQFELPKLQESAAFKSIQFSYVTKAIGSPVPSSFFLPADVKPLKEKLDIASGGFGGSPQSALIVNEEVYDYWFGPRTAVEIENMILAVQNGTAYPFNRCTKRVKGLGCTERS
jgi:hypothetical protein